SVHDILDFFYIVLAIFLISNNFIEISNVVIIYMYKGRVFNLLTIMSQVMEWFKDFNLSASRVYEIFVSENYKKEKFGTKHLKKIKGDFEFKDVYFGYSNKKNVLNGVSFKVKHNETVSFVGKSGAGKSTIFSLLARLYEPSSGSIYIDGINI